MGSAAEDKKIEAFIGVTHSNRMAAIRYLKKANWEVDEAVDEFMRSAGQATGSTAGGSTAGGSTGVRSTGGPATRRQAPRSGVATLGQYQNGDDDSDGDNEYYAGGEKSGQVVKGGDGNRGGAEDVFERARRAGAEIGQASDLGESSGGFRSFTGRGQTLSGIPTQGVATAARDDPSKPLIITVAFYENGVFTVDDGEPRRVDDPENRGFMMAIMTGQCPEELLPDDPQQAIDINMVRKSGDYEPPKYRAFKGAGHKLASDESVAPRGGAEDGGGDDVEGGEEGGEPGANAQQWTGPDEGKPTTSIQIRLADGSRLVAKFNLCQNVGDIRSFITTCRPDLGRGFKLATTFPTRALDDARETIEAAGLAGAVVVQK